MPHDDPQHIVEQQFEVLVESYPGLELTKNEDGSFLISGDFTFSAEYGEEEIADEFAIEVLIPEEYPKEIPEVRETGGRIPNDFHMNPSGSLCLGVPIELGKMFHLGGTLSDFMNGDVVHFLYAFCYQEKHGELPYGEWSHGGAGILEYYRGIFEVDDDVSVVGLLRILADNNYRGHMLCPCGSELKLRKCHGSQLREISQYQAPDRFLYEYEHLLSFMSDVKKSVPRSFISKKLRKRLKGRL